MRFARSRTALRLLVAVVALACVLGAFGLTYVVRERPRDPIERIAQEAFGDNCGALESFRILKKGSVHKTPRSTLVAYEAACASPFGGGERITGYALDGKSQQSVGAWVKGDGMPRDKLVEYSQDHHCSGSMCDVAVFGRALSSDVDTVEVIFGNEETDRVQPVSGLFALTALGTYEVCELRLLDSNGKVLQVTVPPKTVSHIFVPPKQGACVQDR